MPRSKWKEIPADQVMYLTQLGCPATEIAPFFGVSHDTISRRFANEIAKGVANRRIKLRKLQFQAAESGNVAMLIFLGKNMLDQSDSVIHKLEEVPKTNIRISRPDPLPIGHEVNGSANGNGNGSSPRFSEDNGHGS